MELEGTILMGVSNRIIDFGHIVLFVLRVGRDLCEVAVNVEILKPVLDRTYTGRLESRITIRPTSVSKGLFFKLPDNAVHEYKLEELTYRIALRRIVYIDPFQSWYPDIEVEVL
jgi:hypothetical protein